jgi:hypothetical protein
VVKEYVTEGLNAFKEYLKNEEFLEDEAHRVLVNEYYGTGVWGTHNSAYLVDPKPLWENEHNART